MNIDTFAERRRRISSTIQLGFEPNEYYSNILPLTTWIPGRRAEDKLHTQHCLEASAKFQLIPTVSQLGLNWNTDSSSQHLIGHVMTHSGVLHAVLVTIP